jgi:TetR/AcrR family transcriptional regulator
MSLTKLFCNTSACLRPKHARRKEARPGELLDAALELFVEKGFAATRAEEVTKRAGVSKGTLFLYFSSKEELFKAVVRENISGHYPGWTAELDTFEGSTPELLRQCLTVWWERVGATKASGISKLIMSEASNFPELAAFYLQEVVEPGNALVRRILQRGVDRGEFHAMDMQHAVYAVLAPMMFLVMWKHSLAAYVQGPTRLVPEDFIATQIDILLHGLCMPAAVDPATQRL